MVQPQFLQEMFVDSYTTIKQHTIGITHSVSLRQPPFGGNCINWILGHHQVSRCNFLMTLDVPSIWDMEQCRRYMPGSAPVISDDDAVPFDSLLTALDQTQDQLVTAMARISTEDLQLMRGTQTVAEQLVFYQSHEAYHAGQLELLCQLLANK